MEAEKIVLKPITALSFDRKNPRLAGLAIDIENMSEDEIAACLWEQMDAKEIAMSIAANGFFQHEPILVATEGKKLIVIEGNRRLAAVKALLDKTLAATVGFTDELRADIREQIANIPVVETTRKNAWRYLGFKHVNGPAKWNSYAKARYIAQVRNEFGVALKDISSQIGDTNSTVRRLYRGLMVIEQAEKVGVFHRDDRYNKHFSFSHLYTGLQYDGISKFINIRDEKEESPEPIPQDHIEQLGQLCVWLFGSQKADIQPLINSQNPDLRYLDSVLRNREALIALKRGISLIEALEISRPGAEVFEEALFSAKESLKKARGMLSAGYDGNEDLLRVAGTVANTADDLYKEMLRKTRPEKNERLAEE